MPSFRQWCLGAWMVWLLVPATRLAAQEAGGPAVPAKETAEGQGQPVPVAASDLSSLNRLLPVGKTARKVTVPTVDDTGRLASVVTMGAITRIDEDHFDLEKVVLTSFDHGEGEGTAAPPEQTVITLSTARYHAPTRVVVSDRPVTVRKPNLLLKGDSLHYDSASGRALIKGNSLLLISDAPAAGGADGKTGGDGGAKGGDEGEDEDEDEDEDADGNDDEPSQPNKEGAPSATAPTRQ